MKLHKKVHQSPVFPDACNSACQQSWCWCPSIPQTSCFSAQCQGFFRTLPSHLPPWSVDPPPAVPPSFYLPSLPQEGAGLTAPCPRYSALPGPALWWLRPVGPQPVSRAGISYLPSVGSLLLRLMGFFSGLTASPFNSQALRTHSRGLYVLKFYQFATLEIILVAKWGGKNFTVKNEFSQRYGLLYSCLCCS